MVRRADEVQKHEPRPLSGEQFAQRLREITMFFQGNNLQGLIELKLAARRYQDFADVVNLIAVNRLDESFADRIHPSVRTDYLSCVDEQRREAEYEAREDRWAEGQ